MPKLGYGYAHYSGSPASLPSDISGLGLWLKADAGVDTTPQNFVSQIVISGAGTASSNGTYVRNDAESTTFYSTTNANYISWYPEENAWVLTDTIISGETYRTSGQYNFENWIVIYDGQSPAPSGKITFIPEQFISEVTLVGAGTAGIDGTYKRSVGGKTPFIKSDNGYQIYFDDGNSNLWITSFFSYSSPNRNFINWLVELGDAPAPTGVNLKYSPITYKVNSWTDQSGNGFNAYGNIDQGINPTFVSNVKNGKPAISFDNSRMVAPGVFSGANPRTLFVVYYTNNADGVSNTICGQNNLSSSDTGTYFLIQARNDGLNSSPYFSGYASDLTGPAYQNNVWKVAVASYDGTTTSLYSNGNLENSGAMSLNTYNQGNCFVLGCFYENNYPDYAEFFNGNIAEILAYNRALSSTERQQVEGYLNAKYAIY